jgi:trehalose-phosphatase
VEDKGWSLSVHFRQAAPDGAARIATAAREAAARFGLRAGDGKQVVELRAPVNVDTGTAAVARARTVGAGERDAAAFAAGDDVTDEDLFRRARAELPHAVTVRVGSAGVATAAEWRVDDPPAVAALLDALLAARQAAA